MEFVMPRKLAVFVVLVLTAMAMLIPAAPASAGICAYHGEGFEKIQVCVDQEGNCYYAYAMSGPREFPITDTCPWS
jgi:hypothetical protein